MKTYFSNNKKTVWIIGFLVVLNLLTLSALWFSHHHGTGGRRGGAEYRKGLGKFLTQKLDLSEDQQAQLAVLRETRHQLASEHMDKMKTLRKERMNVLIQNPPDMLQLNKLAQEIASQQMALEEIFSNHYFQLHDICNEEQRKKLGEVFSEVHKRLGPRKRGPRGKKEEGRKVR